MWRLCGCTSRVVSGGSRKLWQRSTTSLASVAADPFPAAPVWKEEEWPVSDVRALLRQAAEEGTLGEDWLRDLRGKASATEESGGENSEKGEGQNVESEDEVVEDSETFVPCRAADLLLVAEICRERHFRDFVLLSKLADRLSPEVPTVPVEALLRLSAAYAALGALNGPLFSSIARSLLAAWPASGDAMPTTAQLSQVARCFAAQHIRHEEFFDRFVTLLQKRGIEQTQSEEALSLVRSVAALRLGDVFGEDVVDALEAQATSKGLEQMGLGPLTEFIHALLVMRREGENAERLIANLEPLAEMTLAASDEYWQSVYGRATRRRLLLVRSALRYLHRNQYKALSPKMLDALRRVHRLEGPVHDARRPVAFVRKLSAALTKLKIGHLSYADRGPFVFDVVERDRKLVYECNHFDRFYVGTTEKLAASCLQERIVKAMGFRVVQIPHWQWNKLNRKRQRIEYLRMSRYYAIKDVRERRPRSIDPDDPKAGSELDFLGEYFFRKEMPSASWSWFQPRYDANRRLPGHPAAIESGHPRA